MSLTLSNNQRHEDKRRKALFASLIIKYFKFEYIEPPCVSRKFYIFFIRLCGDMTIQVEKNFKKHSKANIEIQYFQLYHYNNTVLSIGIIKCQA